MGKNRLRSSQDGAVIPPSSIFRWAAGRSVRESVGDLFRYTKCTILTRVLVLVKASTESSTEIRVAGVAGKVWIMGAARRSRTYRRCFKRRR